MVFLHTLRFGLKGLARTRNERYAKVPWKIQSLFAYPCFGCSILTAELNDAPLSLICALSCSCSSHRSGAIELRYPGIIHLLPKQRRYVFRLSKLPFEKRRESQMIPARCGVCPTLFNAVGVCLGF